MSSETKSLVNSDSPLLRTISPKDAILQHEKLPPLRPSSIERINQFRDGQITNDNLKLSGASFMATVFNISCIMTGTGMLHLPRAVADSGWVGLLILVAAGFLSVYAGSLSVQNLYLSKSSKRLESYAATAKEAFGKPGYIIVDFFQKISAFGVCTLFLILAGTSLQNLVDFVLPHQFHLSMLQSIAIIASIVLPPILYIKTLKESSWLALIGLLSSVVVMIILVSLSFFTLAKRHSIPELADSNPLVSSDNTEKILFNHAWFHLSGIAKTTASFGFSFAATAIYPQVESSMKHRSQFTLALGTSTLIACLTYALIAIAGYLAFGDDVQSPLFLSFDKTIKFNQLAILISEAILCLHVIMTYPILFSAVSLELETALNWSESTDIIVYLKRWASRLFLWGITFALAVIIPYFGTWITIIGAMANTIIGWVIPPILFCYLTGWRRIPAKHVVGCLVLIAVGLTVGAVGSYLGIEELRALLLKKK